MDAMVWVSGCHSLALGCRSRRRVWMEREKEFIWFHSGVILLDAKCVWKKTEDLDPAERQQVHPSSMSHERCQRQTAAIRYTGCEDALVLN